MLLWLSMSTVGAHRDIPLWQRGWMQWSAFFAPSMLSKRYTIAWDWWFWQYSWRQYSWSKLNATHLLSTSSTNCLHCVYNCGSCKRVHTIWYWLRCMAVLHRGSPHANGAMIWYWILTVGDDMKEVSSHTTNRQTSCHDLTFAPHLSLSSLKSRPFFTHQYPSAWCCDWIVVLLYCMWFVQNSCEEWMQPIVVSNDKYTIT